MPSPVHFDIGQARVTVSAMSSFSSVRQQAASGSGSRDTSRSSTTGSGNSGSSSSSSTPGPTNESNKK